MALKDDTELGAALRWWEDLAGRALLPFCLLGMTARRVKDDKKLWGHGIDIGVEKKHFTNQVKGTINNYRAYAYGKASELESLPKTGDIVKFEYEGIPINVYIVGKDDWRHKYLENQDFAYYMADNFKIPNPFEEYWKEWKKRKEVIAHDEKERIKAVKKREAKEAINRKSYVRGQGTV